MNRVELVKAFAAALDAQDFEKAGSYLADDFVLQGPAPEPLNKQAFLAVQSAFQRAFPDWSFNSRDEIEQGETVTSIVHITGTHTRDLLVPMPGLPPIPATNKHISLPDEHLVFTFKDGKIASLSTDNTPGGGIPGVLVQIGVPVSPM